MPSERGKKNDGKVLGVALLLLSSLPGAWAATIEAEFVVSFVRPIVHTGEIRHEMTGRYLRDDMGRIRLDMQGTTSIVDPVEGVHWNADGAGRAVRTEVLSAALPSGVSVEEMRMEGTPVLPQMPELADVPRPERVPLGRRVMEGHDADGVLYRQRIPTNAFGNAAPFVIESEIWHAVVEGIALPVRTVARDPSTGTTESELRNIRVLTGEESRRFRADPKWTVLESDADLPVEWLKPWSEGDAH